MRKKLVLVLALWLVLAIGLVGCGDSVDKSSEVNQQEVHNHDHDHDHDHGGYEWIGEFEFKAGKYIFHFGPSENETMDVGFIKLGSNIVDLKHHAAHLMATEKEFIQQDGSFEARPDYAYTLEMDEEHGHIYFTISEEGTYAIVTEHLPEESDMQIYDEKEVEILPIKEHELKGHSH